MNKEVFACYIDFEKAFDKAKHGKLHQLLLSKNTGQDDVRIISISIEAKVLIRRTKTN